MGGFSSAPNTKPPAEFVPDRTQVAKKIKFLYVFCGDKDNLMEISQSVHRYLKENKVPHVWQVNAGGHSIEPWINDLYLFSQKYSGKLK